MRKHEVVNAKMKMLVSSVKGNQENLETTDGGVMELAEIMCALDGAVMELAELVSAIAEGVE